MPPDTVRLLRHLSSRRRHGLRCLWSFSAHRGARSQRKLFRAHQARTVIDDFELLPKPQRVEEHLSRLSSTTRFYRAKPQNKTKN